jgi:hypothetical protein
MENSKKILLISHISPKAHAHRCDDGSMSKGGKGSNIDDNTNNTTHSDLTTTKTRQNKLLKNWNLLCSNRVTFSTSDKEMFSKINPALNDIQSRERERESDDEVFHGDECSMRCSHTRQKY